MVYFICDICQETLKKNKVLNHIKSCRNCNGVSCIDCGKFFPDDTFQDHNTCISEAEKYQGNLFQPKTNTTKQNPQDIWMDKIKNLAQTINDKDLKKIFVKLAGYDNVPRKQKAFVNFVQNSCHFPLNQVNKVWEILENVKNDIQKEKAVKRAAEEDKKEDIKKIKTEDTKKDDKINWKKLIKENLTDEPILPKKLFKKIYKTFPKDMYDKSKIKKEFDEIVNNSDDIKKEVYIHF